MAPSRAEGTRACLATSLRNTFWDTYDVLGTAVVANVLFVLLWSPVLFPPIGALLAVLGTGPIATAGMLALSRRVVAEGEGSVADFARGALTLWPRALVLHLLAGVLLAVEVKILKLLAVNLRRVRQECAEVDPGRVVSRQKRQKVWADGEGLRVARGEDQPDLVIPGG